MQRTCCTVRIALILTTLTVLLFADGLLAQSSRRIVPPLDTGRAQAYQRPDACLPCHQRQFTETVQSVKSGYRNFSPTFNTLEISGNYAVQGFLELGAIGTNLRPRYDEPNFATLTPSGDQDSARAGFCLGCHNGHAIGVGLNASPELIERDVPPWNGVTVEDDQGRPVIVGSDTRLMRDYYFEDANGQQVLPEEFGGFPPAGTRTRTNGFGVNCEYCHNLAAAPDFDRSLQGDGFANNALQVVFTEFKVGPFKNAYPPKGNFHMSTNNDSRINYLRSPMLCNGCHDVRVPTEDAISPDSRAHTPGVPHYRLENLSTEWAIGPYADGSDPRNPFRAEIRCHDCHMSLYPYAGNSTYSVTDDVTGDVIEITSPTPSIFPVNFAADPTPGVSTPGFIPLPRRKVVLHYFTGIDVPLLYDEELRAFLGDSYFDDALATVDGAPVPSDPGTVFPGNEPGVDEYGVPRSVLQRRGDLARAAVRIDLDRTEGQARLGETFTARLRAVALTGHRLPAGFSQERGVWVQFTVSADRAHDEGEFILYQSGYLVDKPHPETDEFEPDGNYHDEDQEHIEAIVNPFTGDNEVFGQGPDNGPEARIFEGARHGLVFFRNELVRIYGPEVVEGEFHGVPFTHRTGVPVTNRLHPRTGEPLEHILEEETFAAGLTTFVDNWRSLPPLYPRTYLYEVELPTREKLEEFGIEIEGPLKVSARVHFQHFPPLFLRYMARVAGAYIERNLHDSALLEPFVGLRGPADRNLNTWNEQRIDDLIRIVFDIATAEIEVPLEQ